MGKGMIGWQPETVVVKHGRFGVRRSEFADRFKKGVSPGDPLKFSGSDRKDARSDGAIGQARWLITRPGATGEQLDSRTGRGQSCCESWHAFGRPAVFRRQTGNGKDYKQTKVKKTLR